MEQILIQLDQLIGKEKDDIEQRVKKIKNDLMHLLQQNHALSPTELYNKQKHDKEVQQVIQIVNQLLKDSLQWNRCTIKQDQIVNKRKELFWGTTFNYTRLDVMEKAFRESGRKVGYDKPWMGESYDAYFIFNTLK